MDLLAGTGNPTGRAHDGSRSGRLEEGTDKIKKMPVYAKCGVGHVRLVDPAAMTLDAFRSESGRWFLSSSFCENDKVRAEPFQEVEFDLGDLWLGFEQPTSDSK